jgi:phosphate transport system protein
VAESLELAYSNGHVNTAPRFEETLRRDIESIRTNVSEMGALAERALAQSLQALVHRDRQAAYSVILRDQYIDEKETELDRLCLEFLVRQQPVAGPLRFVFTTIKLNKELERIGDYAESIARQVLGIASIGSVPLLEQFQELGRLAIHMFHDAVQAFVNENADLARRTMAIEERADGLRSQISAGLIQMRQSDRLPLEALTPLLTVARRFERVTDQSKNICEEVLYMCTGEYTKHRGTESFRILFVDETCSALAPMAEAVANGLQIPRFHFQGAGMAPTALDAGVLEFLKARGLETGGLALRSLDQIPDREHYHVVVALTPRARAAFPPPPTKTVGLVWSMADPGEAESSEPGRKQAVLDEAFRFLDSHVRDLAEAILGDKKETTS